MVDEVRWNRTKYPTFDREITFYILNSFNPILDIDECSSNSHSCDANAVCNNTRGSYTCTCKAGYLGNGENCTGRLFLLNNDNNRIYNKILYGDWFSARLFVSRRAITWVSDLNFFKLDTCNWIPT